MRLVQDVAGAKRIAQATGVVPATVYAWSRDPHDLTADSTGQHSPLDRVEAIAELCATRGPEGAAALVQMRAWFDRLFDRLQGIQRAPLSKASAQARALREIGEALVAVAEDADPSRQHKEISEAIAALQALDATVTPASVAPRGIRSNLTAS
jgi:protein-disulfide isomerase